MPLPVIPGSSGTAPTTNAFSAWFEKLGYAPIPVTVADDSVAFADLKATMVVTGGGTAVAPTLIRKSLGASSEMTMSLMLTGTSPSDLRSQMDALDGILSGPCTFCMLGTNTGRANRINVIAAQPLRPILSGSAELAYWVKATVVLTCSPWFLSDPALPLQNVALTAPGSVAITAASGYPSPMSITARSTGSALRGLYLALGKTGQTYRRSAATISWDQATASSDPYQLDAAYAVYSTKGVIDCSGLEEGPYLLLLRCKVAQGTIALLSSALSATPVYADDTTWELVPAAMVRVSSRQTTFTVTTNISNGTGPLLVDFAYWVPLQYGAVWYRSQNILANWCYQLDRRDDSSWVNNLPDDGNVTGSTPRIADSSLSLYAIAEAVGGDSATNPLEVTVGYTPRYAWLR